MATQQILEGTWEEIFQKHGKDFPAGQAPAEKPKSDTEKELEATRALFAQWREEEEQMTEQEKQDAEQEFAEVAQAVNAYRRDAGARRMF